MAHFPEGSGDEEEDDRPRVAIVGKPNVGKSSIINKLLGENRVIVSDIAGTTRDAVDTEIVRNGTEYVFIDTAGLRGDLLEHAENLNHIREGISAAVGMALSAKLSGESYRVYTLLGDGEIQLLQNPSHATFGRIGGEKRSTLHFFSDEFEKGFFPQIGLNPGSKTVVINKVNFWQIQVF